MCKVSVILTSYNHAKYLREAIESALNQTFIDFELIIWDDASIDDSWEIIQSYTDSRIKSFRNNTSKRGIYGINKAISEIAKGKYIAIHHSDDIWEDTKLEKQVKFLKENQKIGAVFTNAQPINEDSQPFNDKNHFYYSIFNQPNRSRFEWLNYFFYNGNVLCHSSVLIKKECYIKCGLYRYGLAQLGDFDMWIRLLMKFEIHIIKERLIKFRVRVNSKNTSAKSLISDIRIAHETHFILNNYLQLKKDEIQEVFSDTVHNLAPFDFVPEYILAMAGLQNNTSKETKSFSLQILYNLINDNEKSKLLNSLHSFNYLNHLELTSKYDTYNVEEPQPLIQLFLKPEESNSEYKYIEYYISPTQTSQKFIFDLKSIKNINQLRLDPLNKQITKLKEYNIKADYICDNDTNKHGKYFEEYIIKSPKKIFIQNESFIVIITSSYYKEIQEELLKYNNIKFCTNFWELINLIEGEKDAG